MKIQLLSITGIAWIAMSYGTLCFAETGENAENRNRRISDVPQDFIVCTGWHALCTESTDCEIDEMNDGIANCDCLRVNETHIVATSEIQDPVAKRLTLAKCTNERPCNLDDAPVCRAIKYRKYKVDHVKYDWVSTYSYRGWCSLLDQGLIPCEPGTDGYTGDSSWAIRDVAPCTEITSPSDPQKPS
jgi:hypothetical protein